MKIPFNKDTKLGNYKYRAVYKAPLMTFYANNYRLYYDDKMFGGPYAVEFYGALVLHINTPHSKSGFVGVTSLNAVSGFYDKLENITDKYSGKDLHFFDGVRKLCK